MTDKKSLGTEKELRFSDVEQSCVDTKRITSASTAPSEISKGKIFLVSEDELERRINEIEKKLTKRYKGIKDKFISGEVYEYGRLLLNESSFKELTPEEIELLQYLVLTPYELNREELNSFISLILNVDKKALLEKLESV